MLQQRGTRPHRPLGLRHVGASLLRQAHPANRFANCRTRFFITHPCSGLVEWSKQRRHEGERLLAAGVLRLARHFAQAAQMLAFTPSTAWKAVHANELAALAWHQGEAEKALALWESQGNGPVVCFNRGMAALFLGDAGKAVTELNRAVAELPESSAWHHLGQLYLTLALAR